MRRKETRDRDHKSSGADDEAKFVVVMNNEFRALFNRIALYRSL